MTMNDTDLKYPFIFLISLLLRKQKYLSIIARNRTERKKRERERKRDMGNILASFWNAFCVYIFIVYSSFILYKPMKKIQIHIIFIKIEAPAFNSSRYATNSLSVSSSSTLLNIYFMFYIRSDRIDSNRI